MLKENQKNTAKNDLLPRNMLRMHSADYAVAKCLCQSIRPSVCLSHAGILSKRLYISSKFLHAMLASAAYAVMTGVCVCVCHVRRLCQND